MNKLKAIILDLDDTLMIEEESAIFCMAKTIATYTNWDDKRSYDAVETLRALAKQRWHGLSVHRVAEKLHISSWEALWADFDASEPYSHVFVPIQEEYQLGVWQDFFYAFNLDARELAGKAMMCNKKLRKDRHILFSDALGFLENLYPRFPLALVTNGAAETQWCKINGSSIAAYFQTILIAGELGFGKPDPEIYHLACRELGMAPKHCLMVGNSLANDVMGAMEAGMRAIWVKRGHQHRVDKNLGAYWECSDLKEVWGIIKGLC
ncbi:MAG: HAD family hydrolase [Spirochaetales bacterium]|nr:HAD family hydrolase [Spirochaetales bacterium]